MTNTDITYTKQFFPANSVLLPTKAKYPQPFMILDRNIAISGIRVDVSSHVDTTRESEMDVQYQLKIKATMSGIRTAHLSLG